MTKTLNKISKTLTKIKIKTENINIKYNSKYITVYQ